MNNFERIGEGAFESKMFDRAFDRAREELQEDAIEMQDFDDFYGEDGVRRDLDYVIRREQDFTASAFSESEQSQKHALIFEAIFHTQAELNDWLGPEAHTIKSSRYDDIRNGVDEIVEFRSPQESPSHLALAIDVTYSNTISEKLERIRKEIEEGRLAEIKFFNPQEGGLKNIPRVVVSADFRTLKKITETWLEKDNRVLSRHSIQLLILDEIQLQLEEFGQFAESQGKQELAWVYEKTLEIVRGIIKGKQELRQELKWDKESSEVFLAMRRSIQNTFSGPGSS